MAALVSTLRAALRARERQYELRDVLMALRAARDEAERANRLKDDFLATLSHELRTPLNAILGWVSMLQNGQAPVDRLPHALGVIRRNADLQAQIVADVLDMSRIITGRMQLAVEPLDLVALIASAVETVRPGGRCQGAHASASTSPTGCRGSTGTARGCSRSCGTSCPTR